MLALTSVYFEANFFSLYKLILDFNGKTFVYYIMVQYNNPVAQLVEHRPFKARVVGSIPTRITNLIGENNMTIHDLLQKLEEARSFLDGSKDEMASDAHDTINSLIYDVETDGIEGNEGYNKLSGGY
jgi:hypothetical protein